MRADIARGLFHRAVQFDTSEDGERTMCRACGAFVFDQQTHRDFHAALQGVARTADHAESAAQTRRFF